MTLSSAPDPSDVIGWVLLAAASVVGMLALAAGRRPVVSASSRGERFLPRAEGWSVVLVVDSCLIAVTGLVFVVL
jgi:hypothetical protein